METVDFTSLPAMSMVMYKIAASLSMLMVVNADHMKLMKLIHYINADPCRFVV